MAGEAARTGWLAMRGRATGEGDLRSWSRFRNSDTSTKPFSVSEKTLRACGCIAA